MDYSQAIILSIVEGISEFLPISSTGHLVLTSYLLNIPQTEFVKSFEIFIQLGAILAVVVLFWKKLLQGMDIWTRVLVAFIPTGIIGFILYQAIKDVLLGNNLITVAALFIGGLVLIMIEYLHKEKDTYIDKIEEISLKNAFLIGLSQSISIIPGVSRSAASIIGAMLLGVKRKTSVEFSFLLAIPTMIAATSFDLIKTDISFSQQELLVSLIGFVGSFVTALIVVKWFLSYVQKNNFIAFGVYRIILAIVFYFIFLR